MKVLVFSDSHGNTVHMCQTICLEQPDRVLHLGDCTQDAEDVARKFPELTINYVRGNCDGLAQVPDVMEPILEGRKVFMTHGHLHQVKSDYDAAIWAAKQAGAHILLFGHTHLPYAEQVDGLWIMNPGSCRGWGRSTYGVIVFESAQIFCQIKCLDERGLGG